MKDLKFCGYLNVGIYNFEGVGGIYVMYVLYYVDKFEFYFGLLKDLKVDVMVEFWKDVFKLVVVIVMGGLVFVEVVYYVIVGLNVEEDVEDYYEYVEGEY